MLETQLPPQQDIGLPIVNPFGYLPQAPVNTSFSNYSRLIMKLGDEGIYSFNINDMRQLIKQIWTNGGYHGKDITT